MSCVAKVFQTKYKNRCGNDKRLLNDDLDNLDLWSNFDQKSPKVEDLQFKKLVIAAQYGLIYHAL